MTTVLQFKNLLNSEWITKDRRVYHLPLLPPNQRIGCMKALVWFWWIDETLSANQVYQSDYEIGSTTPSGEANEDHDMMMVMPWWWSSAWTWRRRKKNKKLLSISPLPWAFCFSLLFSKSKHVIIITPSPSSSCHDLHLLHHLECATYLIIALIN